MNRISNTTLAGIARLIIIAACVAAWLMGRITIGEAALAMGTLVGAVGSLGLFAAKDSDAPDAQMTLKQVGKHIEIEASAGVAPEQTEGKG